MVQEYVKTIGKGILIFVIGFLWYAKETSLITFNPMPFILIILGFIFVIKGWHNKPRNKSTSKNKK